MLTHCVRHRFNSRRAITLLTDEIPSHHKTTGWVLGLLGKAHFELNQYKEAKKCFREMRDRDPHRLEMTEVYSTALWHLQEVRQLNKGKEETVVRILHYVLPPFGNDTAKQLIIDFSLFFR